MKRIARTAPFAVALLVVIAAIAIGSPLLAPNGGAAAAQEGAQTGPAFVVTAVEMPPIAAPGWFNATATIDNPGAAERTEDVSFRFEGGPHDIVITRRLTVPGNSTSRVSFALNTTGFAPDEYVAGVTTANSSELEDVHISTTADVDFDPQETNGTAVAVDSVFLPRGGYVAIQNGSGPGGASGDAVIGTSGYLEPGFHQTVTVRLFDVPGADFATDRLTTDVTLVAMAHRETTGDRTFDFVSSNGTDDGPYLDDGQPVAEAVNVTVTRTNASAAPGTPSG